MLLPKFTLPLTLLAFAAAAPVAHAANIVTNGDFSDGLTGWTSNSSVAFPWAPSGFSAQTGCIGDSCINGTASQQNFLEQNLATVAGDSYTLRFDYQSVFAPSELKTRFGGIVVADMVDLTVPSYFLPFTFYGLVATSSTTTLEFLGRNDLGRLDITNVSVVDNGPTGNSPIPEPGTLALVGSGLVGLAGAVRKRFC